LVGGVLSLFFIKALHTIYNRVPQKPSDESARRRYNSQNNDTAFPIQKVERDFARYQIVEYVFFFPLFLTSYFLFL
jgi:hypothetical protein